MFVKIWKCLSKKSSSPKLDLDPGTTKAGRGGDRYFLFLSCSTPKTLFSRFYPFCAFSSFSCFQMERRRERVSMAFLLITLTLLLLYSNLLAFHPLNPVGREKKSVRDEHEGYFTTGDSLNSQKRHSGAENKVQELQNRDWEGKNKAESDEVESQRQTNKLRLQHLNRACEEVSNANLSVNTKNSRKQHFQNL